MWNTLRSSLFTFIRNKAHRLLLYDMGSNLNRNDREGALYRAWGHLFSNHIGGAYYEFGVYQGDSFRKAYRLYQIFERWIQNQLTSHESWRAKFANHYVDYRHEFYAFDTFEGMPENNEKNPTFLKGNFSCSLDEFRRMNRKAGIREGETVQVFSGTFKEIAKKDAARLQQLQPAGIVNIDCDLYSSTLEVLDIVAPKLVQGSVILVDDWNAFSSDPHKGQRRAIQEFLSQHPEFHFEPWFAYHFIGQAFLVRKSGS